MSTICLVSWPLFCRKIIQKKILWHKELNFPYFICPRRPSSLTSTLPPSSSSRLLLPVQGRQTTKQSWTGDLWKRYVFLYAEGTRGSLEEQRQVQTSLLVVWFPKFCEFCEGNHCLSDIKHFASCDDCGEKGCVHSNNRDQCIGYGYLCYECIKTRETGECHCERD